MTIKILHVEASTHCNARCPLCPRNISGYNVPGVYEELHLTPQRYREVLETFPDLDHVYFNGNLGDPMMNPNILELVELSRCYTNIFTNGSIGRKDVWQGLGKQEGMVTFSIDGLQDTNHLYRQDVDWNKLMERVSWYIESGGKAVWKYVIFKHNHHQIEEARALSKKLGFSEFDAVDHGRNYGPVLNKEAEITHWILPHDGSRQPEKQDIAEKIKRYKTNNHNWKDFEGQVHDIVCDEHEIQQKVYVDVHGRVSPCCYQGFDLPNRSRVDISQFDDLKRSWSTKSCDQVCATHCRRT